jgi:hypothetical protein
VCDPDTQRLIVKRVIEEYELLGCNAASFELHGFTFQKTLLFMVTSERSSNPTKELSISYVLTAGFTAIATRHGTYLGPSAYTMQAENFGRFSCDSWPCRWYKEAQCVPNPYDPPRASPSFRWRIGHTCNTFPKEQYPRREVKMYVKCMRNSRYKCGMGSIEKHEEYFSNDLILGSTHQQK